jgi:peroxiredoxin
MKTILKAFILVAALVAAGVAHAAADIGQPAPDFTLTDIAGKTYKLSDFKGKTVVLEWVNPGCPIVQKHYNSQNMQGTQKAAAADGVVWLSINSAGFDGAQGDLSDAEAAAWQKKMGAVTTAYFRDRSGKIGHLYGATATPNMYVINAEGVLVYKGAIDSIPSASASDIPKATNYVKAALAAVKAGTPVEKAATQAYGCAIKYGSKPDA